MRYVLLALLLTVAAAGTAAAGPRDEMLGAYSRREYLTAYTLAKSLAEQGDEISQYLTGKMLREGLGVRKDNPEAAIWLRKAAEKGNVAAQRELGSVLSFEMKSAREGRPWLQRAVDARYAPAFVDLGWLIEHGADGRPADLQTAAGLYRQGAELNDSDAQRFYAKALLEGRGVPKDESAAAEIYCSLRSAASKLACAGIVLSGKTKAKDLGVAITLLKQLAESGEPDAQVELGKRYLEGDVAEKNIPEGVRLTRLAADQGHAVAFFNLGYLASKGIGAERNLKDAAAWYQRAADAGHAQAYGRLGDLARDQSPPDLADAVRFYRLGAARNDVEARYQLGRALLAGSGTPMDPQAAADLFCGIDTPPAQFRCGSMILDGTGRGSIEDGLAKLRKASDSGNAPAQADLGFYKIYRKFGLNDPADGARLTRLAAEQGNLTAISNMGYALQNGLGVLKNEAEALRWHLKAAEGGYARAFGAVGVLLQEGANGSPDPEGAVRYFKKGADAGDSFAQLQLAYALSNGRGIAKDTLAASNMMCGLSTVAARYSCAMSIISGQAREKDMRTGIAQLNRLALEGDADSQAQLGYYYVNGIILKKNVAEGVRLTQLAADQDLPLALSNIGNFYEYGTGVRKDLEIAAKWYERAANAGNVFAMTSLANLIETGALGKPDLEKALNLLKWAASLGDSKAKVRADALSLRYRSPYLK